MKILINRKPVDGPWGGGNLFVRAFCEVLRSCGHEVVFSLDPGLDVIFIQDPRYSDLGISINEIARFKKENPSVKIIHRVNECDARKNTKDVDSLLRACSSISDTTVFVSHWMKDYHKNRDWHCKDTAVVYNGVNKDHFKKRDKIKNNKINIVAHHWSDNRLKGADVYEFLDDFVGKNDKFTFTYIGRTSSKFKNTKIIEPISGLVLGEELSKYDIYVSGSRFDPGPNHILESLACEMPTFVHVDGGGAKEFAGKNFSFETPEDLSKLLENTSLNIQNCTFPGTWRDSIGRYLAIIERSFDNENCI